MSKSSLLWVVYKPAMRGTADGINAVCEQAEWDAMELAKPGQHQLTERHDGAGAVFAVTDPSGPGIGKVMFPRSDDQLLGRA
ncbi:hypothetical protein BH10PLA2_BH10PLA2_35160 [soil metagenome]